MGETVPCHNYSLGPMADYCLHCQAIILILPLLWTDVSSQFPGFGFAAPRDVVVQTGLCVRIPCTFTRPTIFNNIQPRDITGIWFRGNSLELKPVASSELPNRRERIFLTGDVSRGDCSLMINDAGQQDADHYTFRVENNVNQAYTFNDFRTSVRVIDLSETPVISPVGSITAGEVVTLTCTSPGRCSGKPPLISWEGNAKMKIEKTHAINHEDGTATYLSIVTIVPLIGDDQLLLTCVVTFESNVTTSTSISLKVKDASRTDDSIPVCRSLDSSIIAGVVAGNVVILLLMILGTFCFLKRHMEKRPPGNQSQSQDSRKHGTESDYQDLIGQKNDIYHSIRIQ